MLITVLMTSESFLCDGSSLVTSGRGQPTMTIEALHFGPVTASPRSRSAARSAPDLPSARSTEPGSSKTVPPGRSSHLLRGFHP